MASEDKDNQKVDALIEENRGLKIQVGYYKDSFSKKEEEIEVLRKYIFTLEERLEHMRLKSRLSRIVKRFVPRFLWKPLKLVLRFALFVLGKKNEIHVYKPSIGKGAAIKKINAFAKNPLISVIMPVYNVDPILLEAAIKSVEDQYYTNWELCITDDCSTRQETVEVLKKINNPKIKIVFSKENGNISKASNEALRIATGEYVALLDNDDVLTNDALFEIVNSINEKDPDIIYSDEDKISFSNEFSSPNHKPDFSPDLLTAQNYICHLLVIRKSIVNEVGGFELGLEGSQDYDLILKAVEKTKKIHHIPKVLYHWRMIEGSTSSDIKSKSYAHEAMKKALSNYTKRNNIKAEVLDGKYPCTYRLKREIAGEPKVSIIIPFKDKVDLLTMCIDSILKKSTYKNFEIIGVSNNSKEEETFAAMKKYEAADSRVKFYEYNFAFNFSSINNYGEKMCQGEHLILLNNDIEIITPEWIEALLEHSQRPEIGVVGAKLYYPNDTIQHAGVIMGVGGVAGHSHKYYNRQDPGYHSRLHLIQNLSALTAACIMVKRDLYKKLGGLNEAELTVAFNDVDFCLRVLELGYLNLFTPYCEAYHHESISRGHEDTPEKLKRFQKEIDFMMGRHREKILGGDPYYNPNLTLLGEDFSLK
jgi:glycosyltransferase involved in cell wall biosynthesis